MEVWAPDYLDHLMEKKKNLRTFQNLKRLKSELSIFKFLLEHFFVFRWAS